MIELNNTEISAVSGGETQAQKETIGTAIVLGGLATGNPAIILLGVLYLATD
jgi:hypothetical protein